MSIPRVVELFSTAIAAAIAIVIALVVAVVAMWPIWLSLAALRYLGWI